VTVTVDGHTYSSTTSAFTLAKATAYNLALKLTSTGLSVTSVSLTDWSEEPLPDADFEPVISGPVVNSAGKANGVYAVTATGELIAYNDAAVDATCLGVALITDNQRIMIEKMGEANAEWNSNIPLAWGTNLFGKNVAGITETTDQTVAKADFNGKDHTAAIITAYTEHSVEMKSWDMCKVLQTFNDGENNGGFTDWYIPAAGQLDEIYTNKTNINAALTAMSSTAFHDDNYWSSSESSSYDSWCVSFINGHVGDYGKDYSSNRVRFVRDI